MVWPHFQIHGRVSCAEKVFFAVHLGAFALFLINYYYIIKYYYMGFNPPTLVLRSCSDDSGLIIGGGKVR